METTSDLLLAYLANTLDPAKRAALGASIAADPVLAKRVERLTFAIRTVQLDAADDVPSEAVVAAKELGKRLEAHRVPSLFEQLSAAAKALVARIVFDSRLEGSLVGLRGGSGFAVTAAVEGVEVELECQYLGRDRFGIMGQVTGASASRTEVFAEGAGDGSPTRVADATIDSDGVFRLELPAGRYLVRVHTDTKTIDLVDVDVP